MQQNYVPNSTHNLSKISLQQNQTHPLEKLEPRASIVLTEVILSHKIKLHNHSMLETFIPQSVSYSTEILL